MKKRKWRIWKDLNEMGRQKKIRGRAKLEYMWKVEAFGDVGGKEGGETLPDVIQFTKTSD